jgi:hypothetical protein
MQLALPTSTLITFRDPTRRRGLACCTSLGDAASPSMSAEGGGHSYEYEAHGVLPPGSDEGDGHLRAFPLEDADGREPRDGNLSLEGGGFELLHDESAMPSPDDGRSLGAGMVDDYAQAIDEVRLLLSYQGQCGMDD